MIIFHVCSLKTKKQKQKKQKSRVIDIENKLVVTRGGGGGANGETF